MILAQFMSVMSLRQQIGRKFQDSFLLNGNSARQLALSGVWGEMYLPYPNGKLCKATETVRSRGQGVCFDSYDESSYIDQSILLCSDLITGG